MYCCGPRPYPEGFLPVPEFDKSNFEELTKEINSVYNDLQKLPSRYHSSPVIRAVVVAALIVGIAAGLMGLNGSLAAFPQNFASSIQNLNWNYVGIGAGVCGFLSIGAGVVIRRVKSLDNPLTNSGIGKLSGDSHWQEAYYKQGEDNGFYYPGYIDTSTLNEEGRGEALFYGKKTLFEHYYVSSIVGATTPLHATAAIAYHLVRLVAIPFYILGSMAREAFRDEPIYKDQRRFKLSDIPTQMEFSVKQIVKAPFYATAEFYAALYSFIDPLNGRKLGALIEKDWNNGIDRSDGFWSVNGPQSRDWRPEGGGGPEKLGQNGFYAAGCWTAMARVHFAKIVEGESMTRALHPEKGLIYHFTTIGTLKERHNAAVAQLKG
ncbi:MAG: hypothetical protein JJU12_02000 [Chlamydiales bacterium]|nr:hypothetical protein [Chlamydiales bacterium]